MFKQTQFPFAIQATFSPVKEVLPFVSNDDDSYSLWWLWIILLLAIAGFIWYWLSGSRKYQNELHPDRLTDIGLSEDTE